MIVAVTLLQFTGPTGARIDLNPEAISSVRDTSSVTQGHFGKGVNCLIVMVSGKPIAVRESCDAVRATLHGKLPARGPCVQVCGEAPKR